MLLSVADVKMMTEGNPDLDSFEAGSAETVDPLLQRAAVYFESATKVLSFASGAADLFENMRQCSACLTRSYGRAWGAGKLTW